MKKICSTFLFALISWNLLTANAVAQSSNIFDQQPEFLTVDQAFNVQVLSEKPLTIGIEIQPGYYLYQHAFKLTPASALNRPIEYPPAESHVDEFFGESQVYRNYVELTYSLNAGVNEVTFHYQGCADAGLCYPPETRTIGVQSDTNEPIKAASNPTENNQVEQVDFATLGLFFLLGIGLAFTPCVFPMYPIISATVVGDKPKTLKNLVFLAFIYVQGMAITYSLLGLIVASMGMQFQAYFQHPAIIATLAIAFAIFAMSMLDIINLQLPSGWQSRLDQISRNQSGGRIAGVFSIGVISGLVASPCTTAPLSGALLFVAQTGEWLSGAILLYALSLGMGLPLIVFAASGGRLLPKAGAWMNIIKHLLGWLLLAAVVFLLERLFNDTVSFFLWLTYFVGLAVYMGRHINDLKHPLSRTLLYLLVTATAVAGSYWQVDKYYSVKQTHGFFTQVETRAALEQQLNNAHQSQQWVMVDLYADWCVACKEFEQYTFSRRSVQSALSEFKKLQIDVTANTAEHKQLLSDYQVLGLPTLLFFSPNGEELKQWRVTGFLDEDAFNEHLQKMKDTAN
ncbi:MULTISPECIES: protein-disulfide reductase DsbD [Idiomarina]|jgi:thiol:disulfide interchange protein DsbD|uniref:protein-disulfide reductase DsbD n=1 Tax=Idiomarina TaxID=135575 RepID=UPI000792234B|nr:MULTISPECIES: protein-disulfide reductase DsbD [Idiomarina]KXS35076.1 MAG: thiol:disulfide interchange protein precursor [Idiomarina sp. T82-3]MBL73915.1 protein-disulfide reductase DsbD [Idiomarinaceae bacterium]|tara:strand:+ start:638 stop:2341 length:1704 start_codon:yes stop_codon:yes gene_type:complete